jgi:hypothetical protein
MNFGGGDKPHPNLCIAEDSKVASNGTGVVLWPSLEICHEYKKINEKTTRATCLLKIPMTPRTKERKSFKSVEES